MVYLFCESLYLSYGNTCSITAYAGKVTDERAQVRREVIAELVELAKQHAAGRDDLRQQAEEYGREDMRMRAEHAQNAWK